MKNWHWHDGGFVTVAGGETTIALHDLTGFEGSCGYLLFCRDIDFIPTNDIDALTKFRRKLLGLRVKPAESEMFDLAFVGGGLAGTCAALAAARNGLKVALIQDRPVLGGNGSSEVRVWPEGRTRQKPFVHVGDIVEELMLPNWPDLVYGSRNAIKGQYFGDERKLEIVAAESRISLFVTYRPIGVKHTTNKVSSVTIQHTTTALQIRVSARYFADCTGDATIGFLAADYEISSSGIMGG